MGTRLLENHPPQRSTARRKLRERRREEERLCDRFIKLLNLCRVLKRPAEMHIIHQFSKNLLFQPVTVLCFGWFHFNEEEPAGLRSALVASVAAAKEWLHSLSHSGFRQFWHQNPVHTSSRPPLRRQNLILFTRQAAGLV